MALFCSAYLCWKILFNRTWVKALNRFKSYSRCVGRFHWWYKTLLKIWINKLSSISHFTKILTIPAYILTRHHHQVECSTLIVLNITKDHPIRTYVKFSQKLRYCNPWYTDARVRIRGSEMLVLGGVLHEVRMDYPSFVKDFFKNITLLNERQFIFIIGDVLSMLLQTV